MICVECGHPVSDIFKEFSKGSVRLTRCDKCHQYADKYVEYELMLIVLDLLLHKPQVYRHILYNRFRDLRATIESSLLQLIPFYLFFDAYLKWFVSTKIPSAISTEDSIAASLGSPILSDWLHNVATEHPNNSILASAATVASVFLSRIANLATGFLNFISYAVGVGSRMGIDQTPSSTSSQSPDSPSILTSSSSNAFDLSFSLPSFPGSSTLLLFLDAFASLARSIDAWTSSFICEWWPRLTDFIGRGQHIDSLVVVSLIKVAALTILENAAYVLGLIICLRVVSKMLRIPRLQTTSIIMAVLIASFAKFGVIPLLIWPDYSLHFSFASVITLFVLTSHLTALKVLFGGRTWLASLCMLGGIAAKFMIQLIWTQLFAT